MDFKKKLKTRLYMAIIYMVIGAALIIGSLVTKTENDFISPFGLAMAVMGLVRVRNYFIITRNEETIRKQQIAESDERNISIVQKAKSAAFSIYILILGSVVIALLFLNMHQAAKWISYSVCFLLLTYLVCYWVYQKKS